MSNVDSKTSQAAPASQGETSIWRFSCVSRERVGGRQLSHWELLAPLIPALVLLGVSVLGYVQSRPNTSGVALDGPFNAMRAFADLKTLVRFGPRPSGSPALERARQFIVTQLCAAGVSESEDRFTAATPIRPVPMSNIVAEIPGSSQAIVIITGHYDTKRSKFPFVGANDGGSSAAFLLEMARVLARRKNSLSYWLLFFDGEEALQRWSDTDGLYGSRHFAQELSAEGTLSQVRALILVDMIADASLTAKLTQHHG